MPRLSSFKNNKSKHIVYMNKDTKFVIQKRSEKAREARTNQFDKNRNIPELQSYTKDSIKPIAKEKALKLIEWEKKKDLELIEWKKKKDLEKQNKIIKKPFLPSGAMNRTNIISETTASRSLQSSLASNSSLKKSSLTRESKQSSNPTTSTSNSRVTRSQVRREKGEELTSASSLPLSSSRPTLLVDEQDMAWIPENELGDKNFKIRRKSLHFSDLFSKTARSPFVFRAKQQAAREPTILENSVEISPIGVPNTVSRNLLGVFSLLGGDETELLIEGLDSETNINGFEIERVDPPPSVRKSSKEVTINQANHALVITPTLVLSQQDDSAEYQLSEAPQKEGLELYSSLLQNTTEDLVSQRDRWQATLNTLTDACDSIRTAIGQTDLLLNKKFPQYSGLIQDATENPTQLDLETRCSDLEGFWDLILREVEDMQAKYSKLIKLAENGYQAVKSTHKLDKKPIRRIVPKPKKASTHTSRVTRASSASLRQQMMRGREQMKEYKQEAGVIIMTQQ